MVSCAMGYGIVSFKIKNVSSADIGFILNESNIFVRTGAYCTLDRNQDDSVRVSFQIYNTKEEVNKFINVLSEIIEEN
jgi:cysteine desulfurase / selenocysteine lyase